MDLDIDASILRTCRASYREALAILYGENKFCFVDPFVINSFQSEGLTEVQSWNTTPSRYNFGFAPGGVPQGRFLMVRKLAVRLTNQAHVVRDPASYLEGGLNQWRHIRKSWSDFLLDSHYSSMDLVLLPALEELHLDFSDWRLGETDRLQVNSV